jgi:uncharacterized protein (DUF2062 family)
MAGEETRKNRPYGLRKILRFLPRRSQLARYPLLGKWVERTRRNTFLWSFHPREVIPAFWAGWVVSLMPIMGIQIPVAIFCAFLFRANVLILMALQLITNPLTVPFIWPIVYAVGKGTIAWLGNGPVPPDGGSPHAILQAGRWFARATATTMLGGIIAGYFCALVSSIIYRWIWHRHR